MTKKKKIKLYQNPLDRNEVILNFENNANGVFTFYTVTGKKVKEVLVKNQKEVIFKIPYLYSTMYLYEWKDSMKNLKISGKFLKK